MIRLPIRFEGSNGEKILHGLFDTGAKFSYIHPDHVKDISEAQPLFRPLEIITTDVRKNMIITEALLSDFYINDIRMSDEFYIVPDLSEEVIIGVTTMRKWHIKLDFEHDTVIIDPKIAKAILKDLK